MSRRSPSQRSIQSTANTQKKEKKKKKHQKRSSKSQVGGLDHWGALDHSIPSIHRSFAETAKKKQKKPKKVIKISGGGTRTLGGPRQLGHFDPWIIRRKGKKKLIKIKAGGKKR